MARTLGIRNRRVSACTIAVALSLCVVSCTSTNVVLTTGTTAVCTDDQLSQWSSATVASQGVRGEDPVGFYIADYPAEKFGVLNINNWHPLSGYKETLCGTLHHFNVYDGSGAEMDWNNFIIPGPTFQYLIDEALPYKGGNGTWCVDDDWHSCVSGNDCLEAEITPDDSFYENPWFPKSTGQSVLEARQICTYGPWIRECVHGHRPEIHTSELMWWKDKWGAADLFWLMALQDDSNRFDDTDEFDIEGNAPAQWRPWASAPMTARFRIAFLVDPAGPAMRYDIGEAFARNVVTSGDLQVRLDADDGVAHAIEYNGKIVVRANENQPNDLDLGVTFTDVCRRNNGSLQGYVALNTKTGVNNSGGEGYHVLFVLAKNEAEVTPPISVPASAIETVVTKGDPSSIRPGEAGGRRQLLGDLDVEFPRSTGSATPSPTISKVELVTQAGRRDLQFQMGPGNRGARITALPLLEGAQLNVYTQSAAPVRVSWPGIGVAALIDDEVLQASPASSAWPAMVRAAGGIASASQPSLNVQRIERLQVRAVPQYAMLKQGRVSLEEGSPFTDRLNEIVTRGDAQEMRRILGATQPFTIKWSVKATNLATSQPVPVERLQSPAPSAASETIVVTEVSGKPWTLEVTFPRASDSVFEVSIVAEVTDAFGSTRRVEDRVWSHVLSGVSRAAIAQLLPAIAAAANVPDRDLLNAVRSGVLSADDPRRRDPQMRRAQLVVNFANQAAGDKEISLDEMMALIRGARLLRQ